MAQSSHEVSLDGSTQQASNISESLYMSEPPKHARDIYREGFNEGLCAGYQAHATNVHFASTYLGSHASYMDVHCPFMCLNPQCVMLTMGYPQWWMDHVDGSASVLPPSLHQEAGSHDFPLAYPNGASLNCQNNQENATQMAFAPVSVTAPTQASEDSYGTNPSLASKIHSTSQGPTVDSGGKLWASASFEDYKQAGLSLLALRAAGHPETTMPSQNDPENMRSDDERTSSSSGGCPRPRPDEDFPHPFSGCDLPPDLLYSMGSAEGVVNEPTESIQETQSSSNRGEGVTCPTPESSMTSMIFPPTSDCSRSATIDYSRSELASTSSIKHHITLKDAERPMGLSIHTESRKSKVQKRRKKKKVSQATNTMAQTGKGLVFHMRSVKAVSIASNKHFTASWNRRKQVWVDSTTEQEYSGSSLIQDCRLVSISGRLAWTFDIDLYPEDGFWQGVDSFNTWIIRTKASSVIGTLAAPTSCAPILCEREWLED